MEGQASQKEFVFVSVENPVIHNTYDEGRYTTYDVILQTNSPSFTSKHSVVKRRYSDFQWLRRTLSRTTGGDIPSLPVGWRWFGTFDEAFLKKRQQTLTEFLRKIIKDTLLISNTAFHLFMQTELNQREMDRLLRIPPSKRGRSMNSLDNARAAYGLEKPAISSRRSDVGLTAYVIGNRIGNTFLPCRSLPVLHGFSSGASPNERASSLERDSITSQSNATKPDCATDRELHVVGSFSSDNAKMHGNSLRRCVEEEEEEWKGWVILEDKPKIPQQNEIPAVEDLKPEDYTNVRWRIGDVSPSASLSSQSYIPESSSSNSLRSSSTQQTLPTEIEMGRHDVEEELSSLHDPCCSQSLPIHVPAIKTIKYNTLSSSALASAPLIKHAEVDAIYPSDLDVGNDGDCTGRLDALKLTDGVVQQSQAQQGSKITIEEDNQENLKDVAQTDNKSSQDDSSKDNNPPPQSNNSDVQAQDDEENSAGGDDLFIARFTFDSNPGHSEKPSSGIPSEPGSMAHGSY